MKIGTKILHTGNEIDPATGAVVGVVTRDGVEAVQAMPIESVVA